MKDSANWFPKFLTSRGTRIVIQFCLLIMLVGTLAFKQPFNKSHAASHDNNINLNGLYSDQTALYATPTEPNNNEVVTLKLCTFKSDLTSANIKYYDSATNTFTLLYLSSPYNIDGWRLDSGNDVANNPSENHQVWQQYRTAVHGINPNAIIVGEMWGKATDWLQGDQWDGTMNYNGFAQPVSELINSKDYKNNAASLTVSNFAIWLHKARSDNPQQANLCAWNSLSTHDISRFLYRANGDQWKMYEAIIFQMSYVGVPMIYYGDEIGLTGGDDPDNRRTFNWNSASWNMSIHNLYKKMIAIRKQYSALRTGSMLNFYNNDSQNLYAFGRWDGSHQIAIGMNNSPMT